MTETTNAGVSKSTSMPSVVPRLIGLFGLYATYVAAALITLIIAGDLNVLVGHAPMAGWQSVLVGAGPLVALLLCTLAGYSNYYGVWRIVRGKDQYDAGQDLKSHAADIPQAVQSALAGRSGCLPAVSTALLVCSVLLAVTTILPPNIPLVGELGTWNTHPSGLALTSRTTRATVAPMPTATLLLLLTPTATSMPRPVATATPTPIPPVINFSISPTSATSTGCVNGTPPSSQSITLDNRGSNVAVSWRASAVETDQSGHLWATINPASGTVPAHSRQIITVSPYPPNPLETCMKSWHVRVVATGAGTYTFTDTIE